MSYSVPHPSYSQFEDIFDAALKEYDKKTGKNLTTHPLAAALEACNSRADILDVLRGQAQAFDRHQKIDWTIQLKRHLGLTIGILVGLSTSLVFAEGVEVSLNFLPAKAIFSGVGLLLAETEGAIANYDALTELFERFEHYLLRLRGFTFTEITAVAGEALVKIMAELLGMLALAMQQLKQWRLGKVAKNLLGEKDYEVVLESLDRLTTMEESRMAGAHTMQVARGKLDNKKAVMGDGEASTDSIQMALDAMRLAVQDLNSQYDQLQELVRKWLSPPDPSLNHNIAQEAHHSGTATWFIQGAVYNEWKTRGSMLWINGKPGSGKSVLCSSIIEDVRGICATGSASLAYYYFDSEDVGKQSRYGLLSSLLLQLCTQSRRGYEILSRFHATHDNGQKLPSDSDLIQWLKDILTFPDRQTAYIIVDALDECPNSFRYPTPREEVLGLLNELVDLNLPHLRVCVTSCPEIDIMNALEPLTSDQISLHDESGQQEDILSYIWSFVHSDSRMRRWREEDKTLVIDTLSKRADGMFRWAFCMLDQSRRCSPQRIREALEELPETLDETYKRILLRIGEANREYAHRVFNCLAVSVRPLRVEELLAMDFGPGEVPHYMTDWRPEDSPEAILSTCSSLIAINNVDGSQVVQFSHFSLKQFLTSDRLANATTNLSRYHINLPSAHSILAQASLSILLHLGDWVDKEKIADFPFAAYAARHWVDHAQFENVSSRVQKSVARLFDMDNPSFATWIWLYDIDRPLQIHMATAHPTQPEAVPLYYATLCGLRGLIEHLLVIRPEEINARGGYYTTPLHAAIAKGNFEIAELLIEHGADVHTLDREGWSTLHIASRSGRLENVRFVLEYDANPNTVGRDGTTPLMTASEMGKLDDARILLHHGADVDSCDNEGWTPLSIASGLGHLDMAQLLIESGATVDSRQNDGWTPLHLASRYGHLDVVRLLIESGAAIDSPQKDGSTPLYEASRSGHLSIVELLIESGAAVDSCDHDGCTPLYAASCCGGLDITQFLLRNGAAVDSCDNDGWTPLFAASRHGYPDIARLLIENGAVVDSRQNDGWTPLFTASRHGHLKVVRLLLDRQADVHALNDENETALHLASQHGDPELVRLLIEHGADYDAEDEEHETPLFPASRNGRVEATRVLLESGATVDHCNWLKRTPLHAASEDGHVGVARLLLDHGAKVDSRNVYDWTSLHLASRTGKNKVAEVLLDRRANVNAHNDIDRTPLHMASQKGHVDVVQLLLKYGANVDTRDADDETALHLAAYYGHEEVAEVLLKVGANRVIKNKEEKTALELATEEGHKTLARLLTLPSVDE